MPQEMFRSSTIQGINVIELILPDQIDTVEFDRLNEAILALITARGSEQWIVDATDAAYMGSVVLGLMVNIRQQIKQAQGKLVVCGLSDRMADVFRACSLERFFKITRTRAEAAKAVAR